MQSFDYGIESAVGSISDFLNRPTFIVLSPKADKETKDNVAKYAAENLTGKDYRFSAGILTDKNKCEKTQCAHIVWYAYKNFGIDLDDNGGLTISPKGLANSEKMEIVQVFGFDLDSALKELKAFREPAQSGDQFTQTEHIEGLVTIHDAQADIEKLNINFGSASVQGDAIVNLEDQNLSGTIQGRHHSGLQLFADLSGQWFNPIVTLDTQKVKEVNRLVPPAKPAEETQPSGWDKLRNFFKERF